MIDKMKKCGKRDGNSLMKPQLVLAACPHHQPLLGWLPGKDLLLRLPPLSAVKGGSTKPVGQLPKKRVGRENEEAALPALKEGDTFGAQGASVPTAAPPYHPGASSEKQTPECQEK